MHNWECKCGTLKGIEKSKPFCVKCGTVLHDETIVNNFSVCLECGTKDTTKYNICDRCGDKVRLVIGKKPNECLDKGFDFTAPLRVKLRLAIYDTQDENNKVIKDVKEQEIYFGEVPLVTDTGTFIINGTERVVVSQLQRSPGVYFLPGKDRGEFKAKIIPSRGAWIEIEEKSNLLQVRLDKKTKRVNITTFLKAMGLSDDYEIIKSFYKILKVKVDNEKFLAETSKLLKGAITSDSIYDNDGKELFPIGTKLLRKNPLFRSKELSLLYLIPVESKKSDAGSPFLQALEK